MAAPGGGYDETLLHKFFSPVASWVIGLAPVHSERYRAGAAAAVHGADRAALGGYDQALLDKTILVGDSGVGKTSLLVQFDQGKFIPGSFSATVGIGFTVMLLGDSGVGKTCFLLRFKDGAFLSRTFIATVGIDFRNKVVAVDGVKVKLQIWDTAGQERFRSITHAYYRDAQALLLLYDITSKMSFDNIRAWLTEIHEYAQKDVVIMLLGNKADVSGERAVRTEDGASLAREYGVPFMETSAKTGMNVELAFLAVAKELKQQAARQPDEPRFQIRDYIESQKKKKSGCCAFA